MRSGLPDRNALSAKWGVVCPIDRSISRYSSFPITIIIIFTPCRRFASESDDETHDDDDDESNHQRDSEIFRYAVMQEIVNCDRGDESEYEIEPLKSFSVHKSSNIIFMHYDY